MTVLYIRELSNNKFSSIINYSYATPSSFWFDLLVLRNINLHVLTHLSFSHLQHVLFYIKTLVPFNQKNKREQKKRVLFGHASFVVKTLLRECVSIYIYIIFFLN